MIAFIDCFIDIPVYNCVNQFVENTNIPSTYHVPSKFGTESLEAIKNPTCYVILGSAAHVTENHPWQKELLNFIIPKLESGIPVLGICYGHQLMANYFGCEVGYCHSDKGQIKELREIQYNNSVIHMAYAHAQKVKSITSDFEVLGRSNQFDFEILKHKTLPLTSTQGHPEASKGYLQNELKVGSLLQKTLSDGENFIKDFYLGIRSTPSSTS